MITRETLRNGQEFLFINEPVTMFYKVKGNAIYFKHQSDKKWNFYASLIGIQLDHFLCYTRTFGVIHHTRVNFTQLCLSPELKKT